MSLQSLPFAIHQRHITHVNLFQKQRQSAVWFPVAVNRRRHSICLSKRAIFRIYVDFLEMVKLPQHWRQIPHFTLVMLDLSVCLIWKRLSIRRTIHINDDWYSTLILRTRLKGFLDEYIIRIYQWQYTCWDWMGRITFKRLSFRSS